MPHVTSWYSGSRVVLMHIYGSTTIEEIREMGTAHLALLEEGTPPIHSLVDISDVESFPTNVGALRSTLDMVNHPNVGWTIIVGPSTPLKRFITSMVTQLVLPGARFRLIDTMEEAVQFLSQMDATLELPAVKTE